ncbi:MAG: NAD(P)/FAD-dependent oxidoreductase [Actinomycetes bacterium]
MTLRDTGPTTGPPHVVVVGAGPAGLMAAEQMAADHRVTVVDHMASAGRKLLVAGRGGLNLTHSEPLEQFLDRYGPARARLEPAVRAFCPEDLRAWSAGLGQPTFVGSSGRVFPESFRATALLTAWLDRLHRLGVELRLGLRWDGWTDAGPRFRPTGRAAQDAGEEHLQAEASVLPADATVLALGGGSWARTGSDGGWTSVLQAAGIGVAPLRPANCGFTVAWSDHVTSRHAGDPLKNIGLSFGGRVVRGEAMLTDDGIEGTAVYALSGDLRAALDAGRSAVLEVDLRPDLSADALAGRLAARRPKESTTRWLRHAGGLAPVAVALLRDARPDLPEDPGEMARLVRSCPVALTGVAPVDRAISTAGGVHLDEVDEHFMLQARPGTFVAGEMLDWDAPTGGYLLQATFSTAVMAAEGVRVWLAGRPGSAPSEL